MCPGVDVQAPGAAQVPQQLGIDDAEFQAELVPHLVPPLDLQRGGADDEDLPGPVPQDQLERHQPGLDGLAEADRVEDAQADTGHLDGADDGVQLVVLDLDAGAERGLDAMDIGGAGGAPADGIKEGVEAGGWVEPGRLGQGDLLVNAGGNFQLPDDLQFLPEAVVLDRRQGDEVLRVQDRAAQGVGRQAAAGHVGDDPAALPDIDELPLLGRGYDHDDALGGGFAAAPKPFLQQARANRPAPVGYPPSGYVASAAARAKRPAAEGAAPHPGPQTGPPASRRAGR